MNATEFSQWWADFAATFPDVGSWLGGLPNAGAVFAKWQEVLAASDARDAAAVTVAMAEFRLEQIGCTDHERAGTARRISKEAAVFARERFQRERITAATGHGDDQERTYRCSCCRDRGTVTIGNPIHWNARRILVDDMEAACTCDAGEKFRRERKGSSVTYKPLQVYNRYRHFRCMDGVTNATRDELREWLADGSRAALCSQEAVRGRENYVPGFDEYNAQQQELAFR